MWRWAYFVRRPIGLHNLYTIYCNYYIGLQHEIRWMPMNGSSLKKKVHFCWYYTIHAVSRYLHSKFSIFVGTCKLLKVVDRLVYITMPKVKQKVRHVERHDRWKSLPRSTRGALWVSAKFDRRELKARRVWSASWGNVNAELDNPRAESDPRGGSAPRAGGTCKCGNMQLRTFWRIRIRASLQHRWKKCVDQKGDYICWKINHIWSSSTIASLSAYELFSPPS